MILYEEDSDPAMRYEGLARSAFNNCGKKEDPWAYAAQDRYTNFVPKPNLIGKRALSTILIKLIIDNSKTRYSENLKKLEDKVWEAKTQEDVISIIDDSIEIVNSINH